MSNCPKQSTKSKNKLHAKEPVIKKIGGSIPVAVVPRTILERVQSKCHANKTSSKPTIVVHSRKDSMNNTHISVHPTKKESSRPTSKNNRSNSSLSKKNSTATSNRLNIDISTVLETKPPVTIGKNSFVYHYVIGKGGFGKVWSVEMKKNKKVYAIKQMLKSKILSKKSINSVMNQRILLSTLKHPFIVNMNYAFQDRDNLYLVMDLLTGGDLRYYIGRRRRFKQSESKFFIACIIHGLQYLHLNNIIHRDIKPENLVLDEKGYLRITDLGIARLVKANNSNDTSGTPGYMAPEVMCRQDHSKQVDYYALGVIAYQFMLGRRPYTGRNRKEIRDQILAKQVIVKDQELPEGWSFTAIDFINRLIQRKPSNRLGNNGIDQIKDHAWFRGFQWKKLIKRQMTAPFIPKPISENHDYRQQISSTSENQDDMENQLLLRRQQVQQLFEGYEYRSEKQPLSNMATTANTYASEQGRTVKVKRNNFI